MVREQVLVGYQVWLGGRTRGTIIAVYWSWHTIKTQGQPNPLTQMTKNGPKHLALPTHCFRGVWLTLVGFYGVLGRF